MKFVKRLAPQAIIFDFDGTLIKLSHMRFLSAYNKTLAKFGYPSGTLEELKASNSIDQTFSEKITSRLPQKKREKLERLERKY